MAKRRRLTPPGADFLETAADDAQGHVLSPAPGFELPPLTAGGPDMDGASEQKSAFSARLSPHAGGSHAMGTRPPIAQVAGEASAISALEGLSAELAQARNEGRFVERLPLAQIAIGHLVRDRMVSDADDMEVLVASIRARGQQVPVEVLDLGPDALPRYGLISGWRRVTALRQIAEDAGTPSEDALVLAIVRRPQSAAEAYLAMVEENEIRADISFYERARIVVKALEQGVFDDVKSALHGLFGNVSRAKRSKIKSFMTIVEALDGVLRFPAAISEKGGLDLVRRLEANPALSVQMRERLTRRISITVAEETLILQSGQGSQIEPAGRVADVSAVSIASPMQNLPAEPINKVRSSSEDTDTLPVYHLNNAAAAVRYNAAQNRIEIQGDSIDDAFFRDLCVWLDRQ